MAKIPAKVKLASAKTFEDFQFLFHTRSLPDINRYLFGVPPTMFSKYMEWVSANQGKTREIFIVRASNTPVGYGQLIPKDHEVEVSWVIHPAYQGYGYGRAAIVAILEVAKVYCKPISIEVMIDNYRAVTLLESVGFAKVARFQDSYRMEYRQVAKL